jgi:ABC-2 type transport system permease protein
MLLGVSFIPNPLYFLAALLSIFIVSVGFAGISIFAASLLKTRERFMGIGQVITMPLFFASNALYPIQMMPQALQYFAAVNPLSYVVDAVRGLMISGNLSSLLADVAFITVFDLLMFSLAAISFRRIIE